MEHNVKQVTLFKFIFFHCCWLISRLVPLKTDIDDCASHPCKNNGTCTDRVNGFKCSCAPGFNGTQCKTGNYIQYLYSFIRYCCCLFYSTETSLFRLIPLKTDIDDCASHPCNNKGTCVDRVNGFNCSCAPGFNGTQCETGNCNR